MSDCKKSKGIAKQAAKKKDDCNKGCCSHEHGGFASTIAKWDKAVNSWIDKNTKYAFHALVIYLFPSCYGRFFFKNGDFPLDDMYTLACMVMSLNFFAMAHWSHKLAGPSHDPGALAWQHFRTPDDVRKNKDDRKKWERVKSGGKPVEITDPNSLQCIKCGTQKIDGVHHCSICNRCVYKMDHHCPWTNNCVGHKTIKPFILFLFYVTCLCFFTVFVCYQQAWYRKMYHCNFLALLPSSTQLKHALLMHYLPEDDKQAYLNEDMDLLMKHSEFYKEHTEMFSLTKMKHFWGTLGDSRFSMFNSISCIMDVLVLLATFGLGCFTLWLAVQTTYYVQQNSSLIDSLKESRFLEKPVRFKEQLAQFQAVKLSRKTNGFFETMEAIFGETTFTPRIFFPKYSHPERRSLDYVTEQWVQRQAEAKEKFDAKSK